MSSNNLTDIKKEWDEIHKKMDRIIDMLDLLKKERELSTPIYPPTYPRPDVLQQPFKCSRCGLRLDQVMGYVCNDSQCPTFVRVTSAVYSEKHQWQTMNDEDK